MTGGAAGTYILSLHDALPICQTAVQTAGGISFSAHYNGSTTYNESTSVGCEQLSPVKLDSSVTTAIHNAAHAVITSAAIGATVHDSATVTGTQAGGTPTGTVTFTGFASGVCTGGPVAVSAPLDIVDGSVAASAFTQTAGCVALSALDNGSTTYNEATSACEPLTVNPNQPTIHTTPSAGGNVGVVLNDSALLAGGFQPQGTITFKLFGPNNATCNPEGAVPVYTQTVDVDGNGTYTTAPGYATGAAGTYRWVATYNPGNDTNNRGVTSGCNDEQVTVTPPPNTPTPPSTPPQPVIDLAITKTGAPNPTTTGTNITWTMVV